MADLEIVKCYNCGSGEYSYYDRENGFNLVKCNNCGLLYVNPRLSISEILDSARLGLNPSDNAHSLKGKFSRSKVRHYLGVLRELYGKEAFRGQNIDWLDFGCGNGEFISALNSYAGINLNAIGLEPNMDKVKSSRSLGFNVTDEEKMVYNKKYDYISMLNVLSHLPDPKETLANLRGILKGGGEVLLETGHSCHLPKEYHHRPYQLPDHLSFANQEIITGMLERLGFVIIKVKFYRNNFFTKGNILQALMELGKFISCRENYFKNIFFKYSCRDMWIRAKYEKIDNPQ